MKPLVIVGAGGCGAEVVALVEDINRDKPAWQLLGFADDNASLHGSSVLGHDVLGGVDILDGMRDTYVVVAVGSSSVRSSIVDRVRGTSCAPAILIHPQGYVHSSSDVGEGCVICRGATIMVRVTVGAHVIVNRHANVGHDCVLGDCTTLHPAVTMSGASTTGARVELGAGAVLLPGVSVGASSTIGAGAVVTADVAPNSVAVGVPARVVRSTQPVRIT